MSKYFLIKDLETKEFSIWTEWQVMIYRKSVEDNGVAPGISEIIEFTDEIQQGILLSVDEWERMKKCVEALRDWSNEIGSDNPELTSSYKLQLLEKTKQLLSQLK